MRRTMYLLCPNCGFAFGFWGPDDIQEDELTEIKTCPCGTLMEETETLYGNQVKEEAAL